MSPWLTNLPRMTVTKAWGQPGRSQWAGSRAGAEVRLVGRLVGHSCSSPVLTVPEASATMFLLCVWRYFHGAHPFPEGCALEEIKYDKNGSCPHPKFKPLCCVFYQDLAD